MFEKIKILLSPKTKQSLPKQEAVLQVIFSLFTGLDNISPDAIVAYILTGQDDGILQALEEMDNNFGITLLISPGQTASNYNTGYELNPEFKDNASLYTEARNQFYRMWTKDFELVQIKRFGEILATICQGENLGINTDAVPLWFLYLFHDGICTALAEYDAEYFASARAHWTMAGLVELLQLDEHIDVVDVDVDEKMLLAIFERQNQSYMDCRALWRIYRLADFTAYIEQHIAAFKRLPEHGLSVDGMKIQLEYLNYDHDVLKLPTDYLVAQTLSDKPDIASLATQLLNSVDFIDVRPYLMHYFAQGSAQQKTQAASLVARLGLDKTLLEQALAQETDKTVQCAIQAALHQMTCQDYVKQTYPLSIPAFTAPDMLHLPDSANEMIWQNYQEMLAEALANDKAEKQVNLLESNPRYHRHYAHEHYQKLRLITPAELDNIVPYLNQQITIDVKTIHASPDLILYKKRLCQLPEFNLSHYARAKCYVEATYGYDWFEINNDEKYDYLFANQDLRQIAHELSHANLMQDPIRSIANRFMLSHYYDGELIELDDDWVWPFFAERMDFVAEGLGLLPDRNNMRPFEFKQAFALLQQFPHLPYQYVPTIIELALGEGKAFRAQAQALLADIPHVHLCAEAALQSAKQEVRLNAAQWLGRLGQTASVAPLYAALKKEKREAICAALLTSLDNLGEDIGQYLNPKTLLAEAQKGLKAKRAASFAWFDATTIPTLTWKNGEAIEPMIIEWWLVLAVKLKDPAGNALLQCYVSLLSAHSQQALAQFVLLSFIAHDLRHPTEEEAITEAQARAPVQWQNYQDWSKEFPDSYAYEASLSQEQVFTQIKNEVFSRLLGSANDSKGMLALCCAIDGATAVAQLQQYMKTHYLRRAQIEAMLTAMGHSNDPMLIQFLLSISRRYRTESVQNVAKGLVEAIAKRNAWTPDELADRTIPTAGLDEQGVLSLDYGERIFSARLDAAYQLLLTNPEGKIIKTLPEARKTEDTVQVKDCKKQLSNSKKDIKQIVQLQSGRLFEAMCTQRSWSSDDWQIYLQQHPIMKTIISRLVWLNVDADGNTLQSFRPCDDGSLLDLNNNAVDLISHSQVILAHAALLPESDSQAWQSHFKDYKIKPLFLQFAHAIPTISVLKNGCIIEDKLGWMSNSFTIRKVLTAQGYVRGKVGESGIFNTYTKTFTSLNVVAVIGMSGSYVPEEDIAAALLDLRFIPLQAKSKKAMAIDSIPPILLAECYADYLNMADACLGFDADWQSKAL